MNIAVKQKLLNNKASRSLRLSDPLNRMGFQFELDEESFYQLGERKWESRIAYLTFTPTTWANNPAAAAKAIRTTPRAETSRT